MNDDLALALLGLVAEERELEPARPAPGRPLVHDDRRAALLSIFFSNASRPPGEEARGRRRRRPELHPARAASSRKTAVSRRTRRRMAEPSLTPFRFAVCFNRCTPSVPQGPGPSLLAGLKRTAAHYGRTPLSPDEQLGTSPLTEERLIVAERSSVADASPVSGERPEARREICARILRARGRGRRDVALAENSPRRAALDAALKEIDAGRSEPSLEWRREFSLMLGLERLLAEEEPHLADGTTLSAHQVDALSGTLIALESELLIGRNGKGERRAGGAPLRRGRARGRRAARRGAARLGSGRGGRGGGGGRTRRRRTRARRAASGSSTPRAPARRSPRSASSRPRAPAAS